MSDKPINEGERFMWNMKWAAQTWFWNLISFIGIWIGAKLIVHYSSVPERTAFSFAGGVWILIIVALIVRDFRRKRRNEAKSLD
jgi:hypothetical protein